MKKYLMMILSVIFLAPFSHGIDSQNREHQHGELSRKQYEERLKFDRDRWYWQMPRRVMDELRIGPGMNVADVGAGIGYFALLLSERVGERGKVYASDIDEKALAFLSERGKEQGMGNIVIIKGREDDPLLPEASADLVLIVNTIHLVKEKTVFLNNLRKSIKKNGRLVFVQWDAKKMDSELPGWDSKDRALYTMQAMLKTIYDAGYEVIEIKDFLPMQLIYICRPSL